MFLLYKHQHYLVFDAAGVLVVSCVLVAVDIAKEKGCYKVMLMSGRGEDTLKFYDQIGFERGKMTGFVIRFV
jgi:hypothetical protein